MNKYMSQHKGMFLNNLPDYGNIDTISLCAYFIDISLISTQISQNLPIAFQCWQQLCIVNNIVSMVCYPTTALIPPTALPGPYYTFDFLYFYTFGFVIDRYILLFTWANIPCIIK